MRKIKKFSALFVSILLIITLLTSISASAYTYIVNDSFKFRLESDNTYKIAEYYIDNPTMVIPDTSADRPIVGIIPMAFQNDDFIEHIVFGKNFTTIGAMAFYGSTALKDIVLPETMTTLVWSAFENCSALTDVTVLKSAVSSIPETCFNNCSVLKNVTLNENITTIERMAFANCPLLEKIIIPESVTSIDSTAFSNSDNVTIYCYENSYAQQYAIDNEIDYVILTEADKTELETALTSAKEILDSINEYVPSTVENLQKLYDNSMELYNNKMSTQEEIDTAVTELNAVLKSARKYSVGDVDFDDRITIRDASFIQLYFAHLTQFSDLQISLADIDGDGDVNIKDAANIQLSLAGLI